jgi:hypothetical protein
MEATSVHRIDRPQHASNFQTRQRALMINDSNGGRHEAQVAQNKNLWFIPLFRRSLSFPCRADCMLWDCEGAER